MLSSINPLGERARGQSLPQTVSWYLLGSVLGGAAIGWLGALIGSVLPDGDWRIVGIIAVGVVGASLDLLDKPPPSIHRQVDEDWLGRYRGWVYGFGFGIQLGLGVVTIVTTASVYAMIAVTVLLGSPEWGIGIGAAFGLARGLAIIRVVGVREPGRLRQVMRSLQSGVRSAARLVVGAQLLVALVAAGVIGT